MSSISENGIEKDGWESPSSQNGDLASEDGNNANTIDHQTEPRIVPTHSRVGTYKPPGDFSENQKKNFTKAFEVFQGQELDQETSEELDMDYKSPSEVDGDDHSLTPTEGRIKYQDSSETPKLTNAIVRTNSKSQPESDYVTASTTPKHSGSRESLIRGSSAKSLLKMSIINQSRESLIKASLVEAQQKKMNIKPKSGDDQSQNSNIINHVRPKISKPQVEAKRDVFHKKNQEESDFHSSQVLDELSKYGTFSHVSHQFNFDTPDIHNSYQSDSPRSVDEPLDESNGNRRLLQKMNTEMQIYQRKEDWINSFQKSSFENSPLENNSQPDSPNDLQSSNDSIASDISDVKDPIFKVSSNGSVNEMQSMKSLKNNFMTGLLGSNPVLLKAMSKTKEEREAYEKTKKVILSKIQASRKAKNMEILAKTYQDTPNFSSPGANALLDPEVHKKLQSVAEKYNKSIRSTSFYGTYNNFTATDVTENIKSESTEFGGNTGDDTEKSMANSDGESDTLKMNESIESINFKSAENMSQDFKNFFKPSGLVNEVQNNQSSHKNSDSSIPQHAISSLADAQPNEWPAESNESLNKSDSSIHHAGDTPQSSDISGLNSPLLVRVHVNTENQSQKDQILHHRKKSETSTQSGSALNDNHCSTASINSYTLLDWGSSKPRNAKRARWVTMEKILLKAQDPGQMDIKDRRRNLKIVPRCFTGSELVAWLMRECSFYSTEEAVRYAQAFFHEGYIVPVDVHEVNDFTGDKTLFRFQTPSLFPLTFKPNDREYLIFLLVKHALGSRKKKDKVLQDYEQFRLDSLKSKLERDWKYIEEAVEERLKKLTSMNKAAAKLMMSYSEGYWAVQRPSPKRKEIIISREKSFGKPGGDADNDEEETEGGGQSNLDPLISKSARIKLTPQEEFIHLMTKIEKLQISLHLNRIRPSAAATSIIQRCKTYQINDPLLNPSKFKNPFITNEVSEWEYDRLTMEPTVTSHDIAIWSISIKDLLWDPKGRKFFKEFLMKEFSAENLLFYEAYLDLMELTSTRKEFIEQAKIIFEQFVYPKAPFELNMESKFRESLIKRFHKIWDSSKSSQSNAKQLKPLDEDVFEDLKRVTVGLMNKNSYQRFISSLTEIPTNASPKIGLFHRQSIKPGK